MNTIRRLEVLDELLSELDSDESMLLGLRRLLDGLRLIESKTPALFLKMEECLEYRLSGDTQKMVYVSEVERRSNEFALERFRKDADYFKSLMNQCQYDLIRSLIYQRLEDLRSPYLGWREASLLTIAYWAICERLNEEGTEHYQELQERSPELAEIIRNVFGECK